jgi:hypothetical protein
MPNNYRKFMAAMFAPCLLACIAPRLACAIDFTPRYVNEVEDGIPVHRMFFADAGRHIFFTPPGGWDATGSKSAVVLSPKNSAKAYIKIECSSDEEIPPFDEKGLKIYRQAAEDLLPREAKDLEILSENKNPVVINDWSGFEITYAFMAYGYPFYKSVGFINIGNNRQIRLVVEARRSEFGSLYKAAQVSLCSWYEK